MNNRKCCKKLVTAIIIWSTNKLNVYELGKKVLYYKQIHRVEPILIDDEEELIQRGITKILWYDDPAKLEYCQTILRYKLQDSVNYCTSRPYFLKFYNSQVSKAIAMEKPGKHFGIRSYEMIAIGDGYNDIPIIEYAGLSVAMGNAPEEIKLKVNYVTLSNDEDGIAHVLDKFGI